jgi:hypothetical protein
MLKLNQKVIGCIVVCGAIVGLDVPAFAQTERPLTCRDFTHNSDGSWTPNVPVSVGGVTMGSGVAFNRGVKFGGMDLAAELDEKCH